MNKYKYIDDKKEHLHTLNDKPLIGTSTVCSVLAKPLTWWASGMACRVFGWENPKTTPLEEVKRRATEVLDQIKGLDVESYLELLKKAYGAHNEKKEISAEEGTDMHSLLEAYVKECIARNEGRPLEVGTVSDKVEWFRKWAIEKVDHFEFSEVHLYSEKLWTGGISDIVMVLKDGKRFIGDFKSSKEAYLSQFIQVGGYDEEQSENGFFDSDGNKLSEPLKVDGYVVFPFGGKTFEPVFRFNTEELRQGFRSACVLYKLSNQ